MIPSTVPQIGTCSEYELLLERCQKALVSWQQRRSILANARLMGSSVPAELKRLQENYARAYAVLDGHEHSCPTCQYVSKMGGLDFDSMSSVLNQPRRIG